MVLSRAQWGGAIANMLPAGHLRMKDCILEGNVASGFYAVSRWPPLPLRAPLLRADCLLLCDLQGGGAIYNEGGALTMQNCTLTSNIASSISSEEVCLRPCGSKRPARRAAQLPPRPPPHHIFHCTRSSHVLSRSTARTPRSRYQLKVAPSAIGLAI